MLSLLLFEICLSLEYPLLGLQSQSMFDVRIRALFAEGEYERFQICRSVGGGERLDM